jgi:hypothetical protein
VENDDEQLAGLAGLVAFLAVVLVAMGWAMLAVGADTPRARDDPEILYGMLVLIPCSTDPNDAAKYTKRLLFDPHLISRIGDPPESLDGCVRIVSPAGRSVYVKGTDEGVARARSKAIREMQ